MPSSGSHATAQMTDAQRPGTATSRPFTRSSIGYICPLRQVRMIRCSTILNNLKPIYRDPINRALCSQSAEAYVYMTSSLLNTIQSLNTPPEGCGIDFSWILNYHLPKTDWPGPTTPNKSYMETTSVIFVLCLVLGSCFDSDCSNQTIAPTKTDRKYNQLETD